MFDHLSPAARDALSLSDADRISYIQGPGWIGYPRAKEILMALEDLIRHPRIHRMPNMLIAGETNNGKTAIAERFLALHPASDNSGDDHIRVPVVYVQAPPNASEAGL